MLTPTGVTSSAYWDAIKAGNPTHVRLTFLGQNIVLDDSDISISSGLTVNDILNGDTDLVFGKAISKQMTTQIINSSKLNNLVWTGEFTLEMGVEIGSPATTYWVQLGIFSGEKPNNVTTVEVIDFTAYDRMKLFDCLSDDFIPTITYPATIQDIYDALCNFVGVQNDSGDELANIMTRTYTELPFEASGYTCRDLLAWIAEACGCYARINASGNVQMVWFTDNTSHAVTGDEEFDVKSADINDGMIWNVADTYYWNDFDLFTWNDVSGYMEEYAIDRVLVKQLNNDLDINYPAYQVDGNTYMFVENPFLSVSTGSDVTNFIAPLYSRMVAFGGYLPIDVSCIGNWCVEAGDIITVSVGAYTISVPIFVKTMHWNGAVNDEYETTGNKVRQVYENTAQKERVINNKEIRLFVEDNYYGIKSGIAINDQGVDISASKKLTIESGSKIDINSGAEIDINSGSAIKIKSGGTASVESSGALSVKSGGELNIKNSNNNNAITMNDSGIAVESGAGLNIKSGGNLNVKSGGNASIESGGDLSIKSGGSLNVNSGSAININSSGTMALTGSTVSIKSGSTFEVDSTNFKINSTSKLLKTGDWEINQNGMIDKNFYTIGGLDYATAFGNYPVFIEDNYRVIGIVGSMARYTQSDPNKDVSGYEYITTKYVNNAFDRIIINASSDPKIYSESGQLSSDGKSAANIASTSGTLGLQDGKWNVWGLTVHYTNLSQNSSKDIKHNITSLPSMGEQIDALEPVSFVYDDDPSEKERYGLIYEDAIEVLPEICTNDEEDKAINYVDLIPVLLKEIQDLRIRVKTLEDIVNERSDI